MTVHSPAVRNFRESGQDLRARAHVYTSLIQGALCGLSDTPPPRRPALLQARIRVQPAGCLQPSVSPAPPYACGSRPPALRFQSRAFFSRGSPGAGSARRARGAGQRGGAAAQPAEGGRGRAGCVGCRYRSSRISAWRAGGEGDAAAGPGRVGCREAPAGLRLGCRCRVAPMLRFPTCFPSFRVVGEKQLPQEIIFLVWSPKRDLIALANTAGEVSEPALNPENSEPHRQRAGTACPSLGLSFCELDGPPVYPAPPFQAGCKLQVKV